MSRSRNIKPGFFKNEALAELPFEYRLLFQGLWCEADRSGRMEDRPKRLKAEIFPYDDVDVEEGLRALAERGFIIRYRTEAKGACILVTNFEKHQKPHHKEVPSEIPHPVSVDQSCMDDPRAMHDSCLEHACSMDDPSKSLLGPLIPDSLNLIPDSKEDRSPQAAHLLAGKKIGLSVFLSACKEAGEQAIPEGSGALAYADRIGIPRDYLRLAWAMFKRRYAKKRQTGVQGWRQTFQNCVEGNWYKLWYLDSSGGWQLTTAGQQARLAEESGQ